MLCASRDTMEHFEADDGDDDVAVAKQKDVAEPQLERCETKSGSGEVAVAELERVAEPQPGQRKNKSDNEKIAVAKCEDDGVHAEWTNTEDSVAAIAKVTQEIVTSLHSLQNRGIKRKMDSNSDVRGELRGLRVLRGLFEDEDTIGKWANNAEKRAKTWIETLQPQEGDTHPHQLVALAVDCIAAQAIRIKQMEHRIQDLEEAQSPESTVQHAKSSS